MLSSTITAENIKQQVASFYGKVREHKRLKPIFIRAIGETDEQWAAHIEHISKFWAFVLLGEGGFDGQPMQTHKGLPKFPPERFGDWLELWEQTLHEIYTPETAKVILDKAKGIAERFKENLYETKPEGGCGCGCGH